MLLLALTLACATRHAPPAPAPAPAPDTWLFTVTAPDAEGGPTVRRFHFAKDLPGPPVSYTIERAGVEVFRMTLLERTPRP